MENLMQYLNTNPIVLIVIGLLIRFIIGRRQFNRRGIGGLQHFRNYAVAFATTIIEWLIKWAANLSILYGIIQFLIS